MTGKIRFGAVLLIVSAMTCGSLGASPVVHRAMLGEEGVPSLTAIVDWVSSLFSWGGLDFKSPRHRTAKVGAQIDPDGQH
jgi:hypothetical protein